MYFDHTAGGMHTPERDEAHIHAIYRKLFTLVKSMEHPNDISRGLVNMLQGLFGADGVVFCQIFDGDARFVAAVGTLSHMENASIDVSAPFVASFLEKQEALFQSREACTPELLSICLNSRFESILMMPVAINGMPYGLFALVSNAPGYFEERDAVTISEIARYLAMLLENRCRELAFHANGFYDQLGRTCRQVAPGLHAATIELIQTFAQLRRSYVDQKYNLMAEPLKTAVANIENMAKRIQDLKSLGDICLPAPAEFSSIKLSEVIENVISYNHAQLDESADLQLNIADNIPAVHGDFTLIWQVFHELIQNAIRAVTKAEKENPVISIRAYGLPSAAAIEISDNGCGIEPADAVHIFEPLFTRWAPCRGLGLTRAQINMLRLHGNVMYHPVDGGGSRFVVTFPDERHAPQQEVF